MGNKTANKNQRVLPIKAKRTRQLELLELYKKLCYYRKMESSSALCTSIN